MNKKFIQKIVLMVILFSIIGSTLVIIDTKAEPPPYPTYTGRVTDTCDNPISGATVKLFSSGAQVSIGSTDSEGCYSVGNDVVVNGIIQVSKFGYATQTQSVDNTGGTVDFELGPTIYYTYTGTVKDISGGTISGALVKLFNNGNEVYVTSTEDGYYSVRHDALLYSGVINVFKSGYVTQTKSVGERGGIVDFSLTAVITYEPSTPTYTGIVKKSNGIVIKDAFVELFSSLGRVCTDYTEDDGSYTVGDFKVISGYITVSKAGYCNQTKSVSSAGGTYDFTLALIPITTISGEVLDKNTDEPIGNAIVKIAKVNGEELGSGFSSIDGSYCFDIVSINEQCFLYIYHEDYFSLDYTVIPDNDFTQDFLLVESMDRPDNIGDHHESLAIGSNPTGWDYIYEDTNNDLDEITIANSVGEGLSNYKAGKVVKFDIEATTPHPIITDYFEKYLLTESVLVTFIAGYNCEGTYDTDNYGFFRVNAGKGTSYTYNIELLFKQDGIWFKFSDSSGTLICDKASELIAKKMYQVDILFENIESTTQFSIYFDGDLAKIGKCKFADFINIAEFGLNGVSTSQFYMDNFLICTPDHNPSAIESYEAAIPLCWLYAPEVAHVENRYQLLYTETVTVELDVGLGFSYKALSFGIKLPLIEWSENIEEEFFGAGLTSRDSDAIIYIHCDYLVTRKGIRLPGNSDVFLDMVINLEYLDSYYNDLPSSVFLDKFEYLPEDPRDSYLQEGEHTVTYSDPNGWDDDYYESEDCEQSISLSCSIGTGFSAEVSVKYSTQIEARKFISIYEIEAPRFYYGTPTESNAYLGLQPYMIKPMPPDQTESIIPDPVHPIDPELPPTEPVRPDPITDPTPPPTKPPIVR